MFLVLLRRLLPVAVLLFIAVYIREPAASLSPVYQQLLDWAPYVTLGIAMLLCINYNRARLFAVSLVLIITFFFIQTELQTSLNEPRALFIYTSISLLLPLMLFLFFFLPERGLRNRYGLLIISIVPLLLLVMFFVFKILPEVSIVTNINNYFHVRPFDNYLLSLNVTIFCLLVFVTGIYLLGKSNDEYVAALLSALVFSFVTLAYFSLQRISVVMLSFAGVSMIVSLLRGAHDMAYRDDLTGLLGRRALNERLKGLGKRYVLAMADVDHFKNFNDTHGHDVGDDVLKMVARHIDAVKGGGTAYRYGGEEFCIVFSGKDIEYSKPFLEAVRTDIEAYRMELRDSKHRSKATEEAKRRRGRRSKARSGKTVSVTISIGVAAPIEKRVIVDDVLKAADKALYKAKQNGRNCLAIA
ncbi:MAG: GGDEF domain-containing protein [Proteobacteria bacterium]|nr:GGDEF domain-containing protein [Pseudomonadota bacterium]NOG60010.1 GGDEF domain-containing protein [Pseudomonadota bacterium]